MIGWLKNNSPVINGTIMTNGSGSSSLEIVFTEATEEPQKYRCVATNALGNTLSNEATLTITTRKAKGKLKHHSSNWANRMSLSVSLPRSLWELRTKMLRSSVSNISEKSSDKANYQLKGWVYNSYSSIYTLSMSMSLAKHTLRTRTSSLTA